MTVDTATTTNDEKEAYSAAARRHMGIAVPENGGKDPIGVLLPTSKGANQALDLYLQSYQLAVVSPRVRIN